MKGTVIHVLMTHHNESVDLDRALTHLRVASQKIDTVLRVFIADLGSASMLDQRHLTANHPGIRFAVLHMTEHDFWAQGMKKVSDFSMLTPHTHTLWLNTDVQLSLNAIVELTRTSIELGNQAVVIGSTRSSTNDQLTYGGYVRGSLWRRMHYRRVEPNQDFQRIDFGNGNILFYSSQVETLLGGFPRGFVHTGADFWFSWRARKRGIPTYLARGTLGFCEPNETKARWRNPSVPRLKRAKLFMARNVQPLGDWFRVCFGLGGVSGALYFLSPFLRILLGR